METWQTNKPTDKRKRNYRVPVFVPIADQFKKAATPFENSVVIGHWHKKSKIYRYKTAKLKIERQQEGIDETT
jgi:hypothetical protein